MKETSQKETTTKQRSEKILGQQIFEAEHAKKLNKPRPQNWPEAPKYRW